MAKNLVIVESPAKAKTIEKILGKDFTVKSSFGHIRDLIKNTKDKKAIDIDNGYKTTYAISPSKQKVVKELKEWVKKVDEVWLATDEDREGEAISWHLAKVLKLDVKTTKRIAFREITKPALQKAIQSPRLVDMNIVNAQQTRRILDRLVGFELSELLWKKIRGKLSAGRVQSVALKLVADRERLINKFETKTFNKVAAEFIVQNASGKNITVKANLNQKIETEEEALSFLNNCKPANYKITNIAVKPAYRKPAAPFTTSTLQQEASRKLGFAVARTMSVAQRLYEGGHITYMRTDSTFLSEVALGNIADAITKDFGANYLHTRHYKSKKTNTQEAHEAVRPTYVEKKNISGDRDEERLYELIWKRTVASQMSNAKLEKTVVDIAISTVSDFAFIVNGQVLKFDGFLKLYLESKDEDEDSNDDDKILPPMKVGQELDLSKIDAIQRFTKSKPHYTEASLVKQLEELEIGRPSTYAPTISKIMDPNRGYVVKQTREGREREYNVLTLDAASSKIEKNTKTENTGYEKNKLFATDLGMQVTDFLKNYFESIINYDFTAKIEGRLDIIAHGKADWVEELDKVYKPFHELIESTLENADRVTGERILGKDPKTGYTLLVRIGRYGPVAQIGAPDELEEEEKPRYANLKIDQSIETINFEEALDLFQFPKNLGDYEGKEVVIGEGRFGPFVKYDSKYISIPKGEDALTLEMPRAIELIVEKQKSDAPIGQHNDLPITKGIGRFGPFVKWNSMYISITKGSGFLFDTITEEQAVVLVKAKIEKEANRYINQWPDDKLAIENGRWGPFIRQVVGRKKNNFKLLNTDGKKMTQEEAKEITLEQVKKMIVEQGGEIKAPKKKAAKKKTTKKKTTKKKTTTKTTAKKK